MGVGLGRALHYRGRVSALPLLGPTTDATFLVGEVADYDAELDITTLRLRPAEPADAEARGSSGEVCSITEHLMAIGGMP